MGEVRSKRPDGSGRETLVAGAVTPDLSEPASVTCSPDGGKILFVRNDDSRGPGGDWREDRNFYEAGADGSNPRKLSDAWGSFAVWTSSSAKAPTISGLRPKPGSTTWDTTPPSELPSGTTRS